MTSTSDRTRYPSGQGSRLKSDILAAAAAVLDEVGRDDALSLRGIARSLGIAAPSIYLHFRNKNELIWAVLDAAYATLASDMRSAEDAAGRAGLGPWQQFMAAVDAYKEYALGNPRRYALMFSLEQRATGDQRVIAESHPLVQVVDAWIAAVDHYLAAVAPERVGESQMIGALLWTATHGQVSLWHTLPHSRNIKELEDQQQVLLRALLPSEHAASPNGAQGPSEGSASSEGAEPIGGVSAP